MLENHGSLNHLEFVSCFIIIFVKQLSCLHLTSRNADKNVPKSMRMGSAIHRADNFPAPQKCLINEHLRAS